MAEATRSSGMAQSGRNESFTNTGPLTFAALIAPHSAQSFFTETWETRPLHVRRANTGYYDGIVTGEEIETAVAAGGLRYPAIQLARDGAFFPAETFSRNLRSGDDTFTGVPDLQRVRTEYRAGATISLPGFHRAWKPLADLARAVESEFDHAVHTNVYITPGHAVGFSPHYDTHDVFILQISGSKHWTIHGPPVTLPHRSQPFTPQGHAATAPILEVDLTPGDLLYLPRGFVHTTATSGEASIHVTLGITVYTWVELFAEWLQTCKDDARFRRALPPGFASCVELQRSLKDEFSRLLTLLQNDLDLDALIETFSRKVRVGLDVPAGGFQANVIAISALSRVRVPAGGQYRIAEAGDNVVLQFAGKALSLPRHLRPTLEEMTRRRTFRAADLESRLGDDAKLALIRHLHKEGFLLAEDR